MSQPGTFVTDVATSMCWMASICLPFYDQVITLADEVEYIWRRKFSSVTLLFSANRLGLLLWTILQTYVNFGFGTTSGDPTTYNVLTISTGCSVAQNLWFASQLLLNVIQAAFTALRFCALTGGKWVISIVIFVFGLGGVVADLYFNTGPQAVTSIPGVVFWNCTYSPVIDWTIREYNIVNIVSFVGPAISLLADLAIIVVTYRKGRGTAKLFDRTQSSSPIASVLLRNGVLHFSILLFLSAAALINTIGPPSVIYWTSYVSTFQTPLQAITVSHFLLNVREVAYTETGHNLSESGGLNSQQSGLSFASFMAPMGGSLDIGSSGDEEDSLYTGDGNQENEGIVPEGEVNEA